MTLWYSNPPSHIKISTTSMVIFVQIKCCCSVPVLCQVLEPKTVLCGSTVLTYLTLCRTATIFKTLEPFWGEEYSLHVPNEFQDLAVFVYDYDILG